MNQNNNALRWVLRIIVFTAGAMIIFLAIAPWLIHTETVKRTIITEFLKKTGIELKFREISLSLLPRPSVTLTNGRMTRPETFTASWPSLSVSPKLLPMIIGDVQFSRLSIEEPEVDIAMPEKEGKPDGGRRTPVAGIIQETIAPIAGFITALGKDFDIVIAGGRVTLTLEDNTGIRFTDIDAHMDFPADTLNIDLQSKADFCEKIGLTATIDPEDIKSRGQIDLSQLRLHRLPAGLIPADDIKIGTSPVNLSLQFNADRYDVVQAQVRGTLPRLTVQSGKTRFVLKGQTLTGRFHQDNEGTTIAFSELKLDQPQLNVAGTFFRARNGGKMKVDVTGQDVDIPSTRQAALKLAGDIAEVRDVFDIVKGGRISAIHFTTRGNSISDLNTLENMTLTANLQQGEILVPGVQLTAAAVSADVTLAGGMLDAVGITARHGGSRVSDGTMRLGFSDEQTPFHLDLALDADLSQVPPVLKQVVDDKRFLDELDRIRNISGRAVGRLILGETLDDIHTRVTVSDFSLSARVPQLPYLLELKGSDYAYSEALVTVSHLSGRVKNSDFSLGETSLSWEKAPVIHIRSGNARVNLNEIYPWLAAQEYLANPLKEVKSITGSANLTQLELNGPLNAPSNWNYQLAGSVGNIFVKTDLLPAPLSVDKATLMATPEALTITDAATHFMDASMTLTGSFKGYREGINHGDVAFQGVVGANGEQWLTKTIHLPSQIVLRPPLTVANGRLSWDRNGQTAFSGDLTIQNDLNLSADVVLAPDRINVKQFVIKDEISQAAFVLDYREKKDITFDFNGNLQSSTVNKLLADNQTIPGGLKGDLHLEYDNDCPMDAKFEGNVNGQNLDLLASFNIPLTVNTLSVSGLKDKIHLESDMLFQPDHHLTLKGDVRHTPEGILFDTDLHSSEFSIDNLATALGKNKDPDTDVQKKTFWDTPVTGVVRLESDGVTFGEYTWRPLHATVTLHPEKITAAVDNATLCGVSTPGTVVLSPGEVQLDFKLDAQNQDLRASVNCLWDKTAVIEGGFRLTGEIKGRGTPENVVPFLSGNIDINATNGRIYGGNTYQLLNNIVSLLNVTEIYRGIFPALGEEGFAYHSLTTKIIIKNNSFVFEEGVFDGESLGIVFNGVLTLDDDKLNGTALVAPLKTADSIIKKIPLIRHIFGGTLVSIPISLKGDLDNPEVRILSSTNVGEDLMGIMERTLNLPVKEIDSIMAEEKN